MTAFRTRLALPLLCGSLALVAACGDDVPPELVDTPSSATTSPAPSASFDPPEKAPGATPLRAVTTLRGTVSEGVEAGCRVLASGGRTYLLLGDVPADAMGRAVTVTGRVEPGTVSTCMQGTPFLVQGVTPD